MRTFQVTCLVLALSLLSAQSVRHVYYKWFYSTASVLDKYDEDALRKELEQAKSLDELVARYGPARQEKDKLDGELDKMLENVPTEAKGTVREKFLKTHEKEYDAERDIRYAISDWEAKAREIRDLRLFWFFGLGLLLLGLVLYFLSPWLGMAFVVPGVVEMIWWTSPSFIWGGTAQEYQRLLNNRLFFTLLTLVLVVALWIVSELLRRRRCSSIPSHLASSPEHSPVPPSPPKSI